MEVEVVTSSGVTNVHPSDTPVSSNHVLSHLFMCNLLKFRYFQ